MNRHLHASPKLPPSIPTPTLCMDHRGGFLILLDEVSGDWNSWINFTCVNSGFTVFSKSLSNFNTAAEKVIKLNSLLKDYCNKNKLTYVDYYSAMDNGKGGLKVPEHTAADDLVHPNKAGYAVMEEVILKALNN